MVHETYVTVTDPPYQTIDDTSAEDFRKLVDLNLIGYYLVAKVFMKTLIYYNFVRNNTHSLMMGGVCDLRFEV